MARTGRSTEIRKKKSHFQAMFIAMGSPCEVLLETAREREAKHIADIVSSEAWRIEDKFSRYLPGNIVHQINESNGQAILVDEETASLLDFALALYRMSDRRFDVTSGTLREAWTFDGSDRIPEKRVVEDALERVGWNKASWKKRELTLMPGMQIDLGGIAKEYAVDRAAALAAEEITDPCLINFGGDLVATAAPVDTSGWQIGIDTLDQTNLCAEKRIRLKVGGLATSGDSRRFLMKGDTRYSHILDPTTGWPIVGAPRSITVAADTCTQAGMLATLAMLKGPEAESFLGEQEDQYWILR